MDRNQKIVVFTVGNWKKLSNIVCPISKRYCELNNYNFKKPESKRSKKSIVWDKISVTLELLEEYDWVFCMDLDACFIKTTPIGNFIPTDPNKIMVIQKSPHENQFFSATCFFVRSCEESKKYFSTVLNTPAQHEQDAMIIEAKRMDSSFFDILPYGEIWCWPERPSDYPNSFMVHKGGGSLEQKISRINEAIAGEEFDAILQPSRS